MKQPFPHELLFDLMQIAESKDSGKAYERLYTSLIGCDRAYLLTFLSRPELIKMPELILEYFIKKEEYEKCAVIREIMIEIKNSTNK